jgi:hypothetical protein
MSTARQTSWQAQMRRQIGWTLLVKLLALIALWAFFFSPEHRASVSDQTVHEHLIPTDPGASP